MKYKWLIILVLIVMFNLCIRLFFVRHIEGISGGDFYNYLIMARRIIRLENPFLNELYIEKRLPVFALLLLPGHLFFSEPAIWGRAVSIISALAALAVLYLLGRELKIRASVMLFAVFLLGIQPTVLLYSLRPLSHTFFTFMVLLSLYLFSRARSNRDIFLLGLVFGLTAMTRHEGFVVAAVLLPLIVVRDFLEGRGAKFGFKRAVLAFVPFLVCSLPLFANNLILYGNPFFVEYMKGESLQIPGRGGLIPENFEKTKWVFLSLWGSLPYFPIKWLFIPFVTLLLGLSVIKDRLKGRVGWGLLYYLFFVGTVIAFWRGSGFTLWQTFAFLASCLTVLGGLKFVFETKLRGLPLVLVLLSQAVLVMFIQPWARHFQHTFPLLALFLALGLFWFFDSKQGILAAVFATLFSFAALYFSYGSVGASITRHNVGILKTKPLVEAVKYTRGLGGVIGFEAPQAHTVYVLENKARYLNLDLEIPPVDSSYKRSFDEQLMWIKESGVDYIVRYSLWDGFDLVADYGFRDRFDLIKSFLYSEAENSYWAEVYRVKKEIH